MICVTCGTENDDTYQFCMKCGSPLAKTNIPYPPAQQPSAQQPLHQNWQPNPQSSTPPRPQPGMQQPRSQPPAQPRPQPGMQQPGYQPPAQPRPQPTMQQPGSYPPAQPRPQAVVQQPYTPVVSSNSGQGPRYDGMEKSALDALNIWGPFAGCGTRRRHIGWLMDERGDRVEDLIRGIAQKYRNRQIANASISWKVLTARGMLVEKRPYFIFQRGLVTMGLNISRFGRDLFISMVSYLKPPISNFRVIVLGVMTLIWLFGTFAMPSILKGILTNAMSNMSSGLFGGYESGGDSLVGLMGLFFCFFAPLAFFSGIALGLFVIYSIYKFIAEKDILAGLRVSANEFNEDDLMAMEKSVEQTVRMVLDEIGLNPDDLKPTHSDSDRRLI